MAKAIHNRSMRRPMVVEVVGPAGAGKTTILSALKKRSDKLHLVYGFRRKRFIPFYLKHAILTLLFLLTQMAKGRWHGPREINRLVRLTSTREILESQLMKLDLPIILDQGPIYTLSVLSGFGSRNTDNPEFLDWWTEVAEDWAKTLNLIVWVDAPDDVLVDRIQTRTKEHLVKNKSNREAYAFLARFRAVYQNTIEAITHNGGPEVIRFDTGYVTVDSIVDTVWERICFGNSQKVNVQ